MALIQIFYMLFYRKGKKFIGKKFDLVTGAKMVIYADKHSTGFSAIYI